MKRTSRLSAHVFSLGAIISMMLATHASAFEQVHMPVGGQARPPQGFLEYCHFRPSDCGLQGVRLERTLAASPFPKRSAQPAWAELFAQAKLSRQLASASMQAPTLEPAATVAPAPADQTWTEDLAQRNLGVTAPLARAFLPERLDQIWRGIFRNEESPAPEQSDQPLDPTPEVRPVAWNGDDGRLVRTVNRYVNRHIIPAADEAIYGVSDFWTAPLSEARAANPSVSYVYGDCEDYVLEKKHELVEQGVDPRNLSIALARERRGELHAVLLVRTDQGELVLDNLEYDILPWQTVGYSWIMREVDGSAMDWRYFSNAPVEAAGLSHTSYAAR